ncbi:MAG: YncE family protein [Bacteroidia bacterium]
MPIENRKVARFNWVMKHSLLIIFCLFSLTACVKPPKFPEISCNRNANKGVFLLNEGKFGDNAATLDFLEEEPFIRHENIFNCLNNNELGDVGNDLLIDKDTLYVLLNGSGIIYKIQLPQIQVLNKIELNKLENTNFTTPYAMTKAENGKLYVSSILQACVYVINPNNMTLETKILVENYGYGIVNQGNRVFVACGSYYPTYQKKNNKIAVISTQTQQVERYISLPKDNTDKLLIKGDTLIVSCLGDGLPSDTTSAISLISLQNFEILHTFYAKQRRYAPTLVYDNLFILQDSGLCRIHLPSKTITDNFFTKKQMKINALDYLNGLIFDQVKEELYIFNGKIGGNGEALVFNPQMNLVRRFATGEFPRKLAFYR